MTDATRPRGSRDWIGLALRFALLFEVANAAYLAAFDTASIAYHVMVVAHLVAGIVLAALVAWRGLPALARRLRGAGEIAGFDLPPAPPGAGRPEPGGRVASGAGPAGERGPSRWRRRHRPPREAAPRHRRGRAG